MGCQSQAAGGLVGEAWIASSKNGGLIDEEVRADATEGGEVIVKPPGLWMPGTWTSSHCPARNYVGF